MPLPVAGQYQLCIDWRWPVAAIFWFLHILNTYVVPFLGKTTWLEGLGWGEYNGERTDGREWPATGTRAPRPGSWTAGSPARPQCPPGDHRQRQSDKKKIV